MSDLDNFPASAWVTRFAPLIPAGGDVLDLACGGGRHARFLSGLGLNVEAVDRDQAALSSMAGIPGIQTRCADLENGPWPYYGRGFDGIVVSRYLFRPLFPNILSCLNAGGVLIYETFMLGQEAFGKPSNPAHLLRPEELLTLVRPKLKVIAFEQGEIATPRPAVIQRICAKRGSPQVLPEAIGTHSPPAPTLVQGQN